MTAWSLTDKVILITGGARGIGAATARELAERGLAASVSERTGGQVSHEGDRVHAASSASSGGG